LESLTLRLFIFKLIKDNNSGQSIRSNNNYITLYSGNGKPPVSTTNHDFAKVEDLKGKVKRQIFCSAVAIGRRGEIVSSHAAGVSLG